MTGSDEEACAVEYSGRPWAEVAQCVSVECQSHGTIDDALRGWLDWTAQISHDSSEAHEDVKCCVQILLDSQLFCANKDYVRTQIIHSLLQEDDAGPLYAIACLLLLDGHFDESAFSRMVDEACFSRLLELLNAHRAEASPRLHLLLLHLMYEMSRIERLNVDDLQLVDDSFIHHLFGAIEGTSDGVQGPYYYPTIRVLLVLNEQYMLASTEPVSNDGTASARLTNRVVKCLSLHGPLFRTFGENIILLLNRETETSLQLLILKLLYLLFTTPLTYEYFYTNDLRVLLDVIIRNLMDLPEENLSLRHTYLRVMYPLLAHTQLNQPPHYKRGELLRVLQILRGSRNAHFAPADETTLRLVDRVAKVKWLAGEISEDMESSGQAEVARKILGISLSLSQCASSVSVGDLAGVRERPGVQTPSRHGSEPAAHDVVDTPSQEEVVAAVKAEKPLPAVPRQRVRVIQPTTGTIVNGSGKKTPPQAPPPRRIGRVKTLRQPSPGPLTKE